MNFSLHIVENYDSRGSDSEHDESQKPKKEPDGATEGLVGGLGDAEGSKESSCEGFQESHAWMVRRWIAGGTRLDWVRGEFSVLGVGRAVKNPPRHGNIQYCNGCGLLQRTPGARLNRRSIRMQSRNKPEILRRNTLCLPPPLIRP